MLEDEKKNSNIMINQLLYLIEERDYFIIYSKLEEILLKMKKIIIKEESLIQVYEKFVNTFFNNYNITETNVYFVLSFFMLINSNIMSIPKLFIEKIFIDNEKISKTEIQIFKLVYLTRKNEENFQIPSLSQFINFCFKLPDLLTNYFQSSFINYSQYYEALFAKLLLNEDVFALDEILSKISNLKLYNHLYSTFINHDFSEETIQNYHKIINKNEFLRDKFYNHFFQFSCFGEKNFQKFQQIYDKIENFGNFQKLDQIFRKNPYFISFILSGKNVNLQKQYLNSSLVLLKNKNQYIVEEIENYDFYLVFFSFYYLLETIKDLEVINIFDGLMKIMLLVMDIVSNRNKKGIIQLFMGYLKKKIYIFLNSARKKQESEEEKKEDEYIYFDENQKNLLNFEKNKQNFEENKFYFCDIETEKSFKKEFYHLILRETTNFTTITKDNTKIHNDKNNSSNRKNKTVYKSIKFQKKYGVFNQNSNKKLLLTPQENEVMDDIIIPSSNSNSIFKMSLVENDDYSDLKKVDSPQYIKDCILGLNSQYKERQELSLKSLPSLIDSQPLDLELSLTELSNCILRLDNSFDIENFDELVEEILVKLIKFAPDKLTKILCERFFSENNCGVKSKFVILTVINRAVEEISEYYQNNNKPKVNLFHPYFINVIFPLLNYLQKQKLEFLITYDNFDLLLAKFIFIISNIIKVSENHPLVNKALFETFELFQAIIKMFTNKIKSHTLIESLNFYVNSSLNFYKSSFISIYPEYLGKLQIEIKYLNELLSDTQLNEDLRLRILATLNKYILQSQKFKSNYFNISDFN